MRGDIDTQAWVLHRGIGNGEPGQLVCETFSFPDIVDDEVLVRPLVGCWEGNMDHALSRVPVDICAQRGEDKVVVGNAGVVQVERVGPSVKRLREGELCVVFCNGEPDEHGYPVKILGYDCPGTMGVLAKTAKLKERQLVPLPSDQPYELGQWAAFSLRYITAWANWRLAYGCFRAQLPDVPPDQIHVFAWGGGVSFAELSLARAFGCRATMVTSRPERLTRLQALGIDTIDRSALSPDRFEQEFLAAVMARTGGRGASIFVDNIGSNFKTTLKALAREGVITTSGWRNQATYPISRAMECIARHTHVFTHYARYPEGVAAVRFALEHGWVPPIESEPFAWEDISRLSALSAAGTLTDYFPLFRINDARSS